MTDQSGWPASILADESTWIVAGCLVLMAGGRLSCFVVVIWYYRRRSLSDDEPSSTVAWTLDDLRRMRAEGSLTEEEYQTLRAADDRALTGAGAPETGKRRCQP